MPIVGPIVHGPSNLDFYGLRVVERLGEMTVASRQAFYGQHNAVGNAYIALRIEANRQLAAGMAVINIRESFTLIQGLWTCRLKGTIVRTAPKESFTNTAVGC